MRLIREETAIANLWHDERRVAITIESSVSSRVAPNTAVALMNAAGAIRQPSARGTVTLSAREVTDGVLDLLTQAYREAAGVPIAPS